MDGSADISPRCRTALCVQGCMCVCEPVHVQVMHVHEYMYECKYGNSSLNIHENMCIRTVCTCSCTQMYRPRVQVSAYLPERAMFPAIQEATCLRIFGSM